MVTSVTAQEAAGRLPELLALVDRGEHVVITAGEREVAHLVPPDEAATPLVPAQATVELRRSLLTGSESMHDIALPGLGPEGAG